MIPTRRPRIVVYSIDPTSRRHLNPSDVAFDTRLSRRRRYGFFRPRERDPFRSRSDSVDNMAYGAICVGVYRIENRLVSSIRESEANDVSCLLGWIVPRTNWLWLTTYREIEADVQDRIRIGSRRLVGALQVGWREREEPQPPDRKWRTSNSASALADSQGDGQPRPWAPCHCRT